MCEELMEERLSVVFCIHEMQWPLLHIEQGNYTHLHLLFQLVASEIKQAITNDIEKPGDYPALKSVLYF